MAMFFIHVCTVHLYCMYSTCIHIRNTYKYNTLTHVELKSGGNIKGSTQCVGTRPLPLHQRLDVILRALPKHTCSIHTVYILQHKQCQISTVMLAVYHQKVTFSV